MLLRFKLARRSTDLETGKPGVVKGTISCKRDVRLPHVGGTCVYFNMLVEGFGTGARGKGRPMWLPVRREVKCTEFFIEDASGRVLVTASKDCIDASGGRSASGMIGKKGNQRYEVRFIRDGDRVKVRGLVSDPRGAEPGDTPVIRPDEKGIIELLFLGKGQDGA
jgi:hypothetical protein